MVRDIFFYINLRDYIAWVAFPFLIPVWCIYSLRVSIKFKKESKNNLIFFLSILGFAFPVFAILLHMRIFASITFTVLSILYPLAIVMFVKLFIK